MAKKKKLSKALSKMVLDRKRMAEELLAAIDAHGRTLVAGVEARFLPLLEDGEPMSDVRHFLGLVRRDLVRILDSLSGAASSHGVELAGAARRRRERREAQAELKALLRDMRQAVMGCYGAEGAFLVHGLKGRTARGALKLAEQGSLAAMLLARPDEDLPQPKVGGVRIDRADWVKQLQPAVQRLRAAVSEPRWEEGTMIDKWKAIEEFDDSFGRQLAAVRGLFLLAGQEELFRLLRKEIGVLRRGKTPGRRKVEKMESAGISRGHLWLNMRRWLRRRLAFGRPPKPES